MSEPTPVISSTNVIDSGSSSRPTLTWKSPTAIQVNMCTSRLRLVYPSRSKKQIRPTTNDPIGIAVPSRCPHRLVRRPPKISTRAPNTGNASISQA
jgi:hypothetical protein